MATLTVGSGGQYATISAAVAAAQADDTIDVQGGTYTNDFPPLIDKNLTLQAVGGMVNMVATQQPSNGKAILDVGAAGVTVSIDGFSFSGTTVPDGNGAGIRYEGGTLNLTNDYFHNNQDGLLGAADPNGVITIDHTEFANNGAGDGQTHNLYVGQIATLTVENSYFAGANVGHQIKSRALNNTIINNRIQDGTTGTSSYCIDLPNGGNALIENNVIEKGPNAQNPNFISFGEEGSVYANSSLTVTGNTFLNDYGSNANAVVNDTTATAQITNNSVYDLTSAHMIAGSGTASVSGTVVLTTEPALDTSAPYSIACYLVGTLILTPRGEVPIEDLAIGDEVVTRDGGARRIKWIGRRSYAAAFARGNVDAVPVRIAAGALADGVPHRDLIVSPKHALHLDDALVAAEDLVNGVTIRRCPDIDPIRYVHVELDTHDVIFAEGAAAETFVDCDNRGMFSNAADFARHYPADRSPAWQFCAPRLVPGERLEALRRRLEARAGMAPPAAAQLVGYFDGVEGTRLSGWALDPARPGVPVWLEVLDDEAVIARISANQHRPDVAAAGHGDGWNGFAMELPAGFCGTWRLLRVRRVADGAELPGSPLSLPPEEARGGHDAATLPAAVATIRTATDVVADLAEEDALLGALLGAAERLRRRRAARLAARPEAPRALVIDDAWPRPDRDAGSQAVLGHMEALQALGWQVEFVTSAGADGAEAARRLLAARGILCHGAPDADSVEQVLRRQADGYALVYLHRLASAEAYAGLARRWQRRARLLYSVADLHHLRVQRQAALTGDADLRAEARTLQQREFAALRACDIIVTHSTAEAAYLAPRAPGAAIHVVPWPAVPARARRRSFASRRGLVFLGSFRHSPNLDAARWLVEAVLPEVWARTPDLPCVIAGSDWPASLSWLEDRRVEVRGHVADLPALFARMRLSVAPLRFGAGLKGKVLDSYATGLPCAMTPIAAEGLPLGPLLRQTVAESPAALAEVILRLHEAADFNAACAGAGRDLIAEQFSPATVQAALADALRPSPARIRAA